MHEVLTTAAHYDHLIDHGHDCVNDPPFLREYMAQSDGPRFFEALGDTAGKHILEVGVGTGRLAQQVLSRGCRRFTGIDVSARTIAAARKHLAGYVNVELLVENAEGFARAAAFDAVYCVQTEWHIQDKKRALANMAAGLRPGGRLVLSVGLIRHERAEGEEDWMDDGDHRLRLYRATPQQYAGWLQDLGCEVAQPVTLVNTCLLPNGKESDGFGKPVASLIVAVRPPAALPDRPHAAKPTGITPVIARS
jgi:SAM-dependent methyltransferase